MAEFGRLAETVHGQAAALQRLTQRCFRLVLIHTPRLDATPLILCRIIDEHFDRAPRPAVMIMTHAVEPAEMLAAYDAGADDMISESDLFYPRVVAARIEALLRRLGRRG